jgi:hypothetical protein
MNNEPVAWAREDGVIAFFEKPKVDKQGFKWFPLYTHPAKTLTDEEIADMVCSGEYWELSEGQVIIAVHFDKFARAILKKASEK